MTRPLRLFINGFGRIGRTVTRQILTDPRHRNIEIVAINDIAPLETCAYLFHYDSTFGPFPGTVDTSRGAIVAAGRSIPFHSLPDLAGLDLSGVDVLLECTGRIRSRSAAERGLAAGTGAVLIAGPADHADVTVVLGANEHDLGNARIVSNSSCTTNAIAPLLRRLDHAIGIDRAHVTTIHCYTGSQPTVDAPRGDLARSRAAAVSMVPTTTSAAHQVTCVLPDLEGRLSVAAVRVPCLSVSAIDATIQVSRMPDGPLPSFLRDAFEEEAVIGLTEDACVSTDLRARPESLVIALPETQIVQGRQLRLFGWYDNEWGYSARMIDMAMRMARRADTTKTGAVAPERPAEREAPADT